MNTRRNFLLGVSATLIGAPAIVRVQSLMPLRGIILPYYFGFIERLYVHTYLSKIAPLQNAGLSFGEIAADLNRREWDRMNGTVWNMQGVMSVITRDRLIRRQDRC